jgi:hypothetical protein
MPVQVAIAHAEVPIRRADGRRFADVRCARSVRSRRARNADSVRPFGARVAPISAAMRYPRSACASRRKNNKIKIECMQLELDVVRISQRYEWPPVLVLDLRVLNTEQIEVPCPFFESRSIANVECKVIEPDGTLVERRGRRVLVGHEPDGQPARMEHAPDPEPWPLHFEEQPEAQYLGPPARAALAIRDGEVDVPEAFDPGGAHAPHLVGSSGDALRSRRAAARSGAAALADTCVPIDGSGVGSGVRSAHRTTPRRAPNDGDARP